MKYETLVEMHRRAYLWDNWFSYDFEPKPEYTIFDFLRYLPVTLIYYMEMKIEKIWHKRKKWVIAKKPTVESITSKVDKQQ